MRTLWRVKITNVNGASWQHDDANEIRALTLVQVAAHKGYDVALIEVETGRVALQTKTIAGVRK